MIVAVLMVRRSPWMRQIVRRLAKSGHEVVALAIEEGKRSSSASSAVSEEMVGGAAANACVRWHPLALGHPLLHGPKAMQLAGALPKLCREARADVLLTLYGGNFALGAWLSRVRPYVVYVVGSDVLFMNGARRLLTSAALTGASAVPVNGGYLARRTQEIAPRARITPLLIGVDTDVFRPLDDRPLPVRIVCTRAFKPVYDNERLIEALRLLEGSDADFSVTFTSDGPLLDRARSLAREILSPGLNARVEFLGGVLDEVLRDAVRRAHVYVSMSLSDGTSTSLLEAMSCGVFPVVSDIPQNREWVEPETGNGILVPIGDAQALAEALRRSIVDLDMREKAAGPNRARIQEAGNGTVNVMKLTAILESAAREQ